MSRAKPNRPKECKYAGKGGLKLEFALEHFGCDITDKIVADLGSHQGGFVDCLLQHGAQKVYSVDTCYGLLDWNLRNDKRVQIFERKNALHWRAPEKLSYITIDVGWTKQELIIPAAMKNLADNGIILTLLKPQYESDKVKLHKGVIDQEELDNIFDQTKTFFTSIFSEVLYVYSPYIGSGGNTEIWFFSKKIEGFTLLEVLIALVIFLLGSLSIWSLFAVAIDTYNESVDMQIASLVAESIIAELEDVDIVVNKPIPEIEERQSFHFPDYKFSVKFVDAQYGAVFVKIKIFFMRRGQQRSIDFYTVLNKSLSN